MLPGINVEDIKKYNENLRAHRDRASKIKAEIEFNTVEMNRLCAELTADLGIQVTPANLSEICADRTLKINDTLSVGTEILKRIAEEEAAAASAPVAVSIPDIGVGVVVTHQGPAMNDVTPPPMMPLGPIGTIGTAEQQAVFGQNGAVSMFSSLDGGKELFGETPAKAPSIGDSIRI